MQNKNPARFYCKEIIKQGYDKKNYLRLMLNTLKVMENSTFIYTYWAPSFKKFIKKLSIHMWSIFTHVSPCVAHVYSYVNYE